MLTHSYSHDFVLSIPIYEEVKKICRDHTYHPKLNSHCIAVPIYIIQHDSMIMDFHNVV